MPLPSGALITVTIGVAACAAVSGISAANGAKAITRAVLRVSERFNVDSSLVVTHRRKAVGDHQRASRGGTEPPGKGQTAGNCRYPAVRRQRSDTGCA